jgi:TolB-like protein
MPENNLQHRLVAILSADVAGYSRLMAEDEMTTIRTLSVYRDKMIAHVSENGGQVVDFIGDNMLGQFTSALDAVNCAANIQATLADLNTKLDENRQMYFRIGINIGDILIDEDVIYGEGVNIAARLQSLAEPGGICISEFVYTQVHKKLELSYVDLGTKELKNIPDPVRVYRVVDKEVEIPPQTIKTAPVHKPLLPFPDKPSLAVLPFVNLSIDSNQDYFSDGLTMDIMTALVRIPGLFLISEISMFSYKSNPVSIRQLSHQLGVSHVLEGGVRKEGEQIRLTARLTETKTGHQIWARRFDRHLKDIFSVQDEITDKIVTAMDIKLVTGESARTIRKTITNPDALECFYRGWEALFGTTKEDIQEAQEMFEKTIRLEPESSIGYALAAWAHWWAADQGLSDDILISIEKAKALSESAMDLEDFTGLPHLVMAQIHLFHREHDKALTEVENAVIARPSCDLSYTAKANILTYLGRSAEAIDLARFAMRIAPVYPPFFQAILASAYYGNSQYEEAITTAKEVLKKDPNNLGAFLIIAGANAALDRWEEAHTAASEVRRFNPDFTLKKYSDTQPYKDPETLAQVINRLERAGLH